MENKDFKGLFGQTMSREDREEIARLFYIVARNSWSTICTLSQILVGVKPQKNRDEQHQA